MNTYPIGTEALDHDPQVVSYALVCGVVDANVVMTCTDDDGEVYTFRQNHQIGGLPDEHGQLFADMICDGCDESIQFTIDR